MTLLLGGLFSSSAAEAQQADKVARIGYLSINLAAFPANLHEAFRQGLRDLGYVEGRNVVIEYRDAGGSPSVSPRLQPNWSRSRLMASWPCSTPNALAAKQATKTIPIVFLGSGDPVRDGLVTSLARPGGNVTGLSSLIPERVGKCLELLTPPVPGVNRVAVLWQPGAVGERTEKDTLKEAEVAARALGVRPQFVAARGPADIDRVFL
jgi:putative ABC transport system substrate-binding protein